MSGGYMEVLSGALKQGVTLHAFLSGGGLRVVSLSRGGADVGYGEHPNVEDALSHAAEDFTAGGRPYKQVYGKSKPAYLTGSRTATSELDLWIRQGRTVDARMSEDGAIEVVLSGLKHQKLPEDVRDQVSAGAIVRWRARGRLFESKSQWGGCSTDCIERPEGGKDSEDWMYPITRTGRGKGLEQAVGEALKASEVEVAHG
jgi:hypothetical protein